MKIDTAPLEAQAKATRQEEAAQDPGQNSNCYRGIYPGNP